MARNTTTKTTKTEAPVASVPAESASTPKAKKEKKERVKKDDVKPVADASSTVTVEEQTEGAVRVAATPESVLNSFDDIIKSVDSEIELLRDASNKTKGVKFLRSLNKNLKTLKTQTSRAMRKKHRTNRTTNTNSGFLKPVKMSSAMAKFTGWDQNTPRSRVDVTKYICDYIKQNNLQNPTDRRQIIVDNKLGKLLGYDPTKTEDPMTYYRIQSYLKPHFIKNEATAAPVTATA